VPEPSAQESPQQPSLYRRHRPRTFADVVGQEAVVRTLRNAVQRGKVHHAYLFVGSRGTGKTSMAKILAACLNCQQGPTVEPCGECESCLAIARASSLDVIEMDAASNNSVDDIRELRDSVAYAPLSGRQKVYILDEAHMLSTAAWNAFLKTLEEPPPNTVFVLATTEANKVPATVVDRCHRFDFHRPSVEQLAAVVRRAAAAESIEIPPEAVAALARAATGSFRDALGTLEQLVTYSGPEIALEDVLAVLGVTDAQLLEEVFDALQAGDARAVLLAVASCADAGRDAGSFAADLEERARELLIAQTLGGVPPELALTPEHDERLAAQAQRVGRALVVRVLELLAAALEAARAGADPRTQLELALVKAASPELDPSRQALLARIERLESRAGAPAAIETPAAAEPIAPLASAPPLVPAEEPAAPSASEPPPAAPTAAPAPAPLPPAGEPALDSLSALWPAVVEAVRASNAMLAAAIAEARPVALEGEELTVAFDVSAPFMKKKAEDPANRALVTQALKELTGRRLRLAYELHEQLNGSPEPGAGHTEEEWVARFIDEFDAQELPGEPAAVGGETPAGEPATGALPGEPVSQPSEKGP
jgi:DNA polymerase-3 subunit gamma/tau